MSTLQRTANNPKMLRLIIAVILLTVLWEPLRPIRSVTAEALYTAGDLIAR